MVCLYDGLVIHLGFNTGTTKMKLVENHFSARHGWVFLLFLIVCTVLNFFVLDAGVDDGEDHSRQVLVTTLATISGPMTGAIARDFQGCCTRFSVRVLLIISGPALVLSTFMQVIRLPFRKGQGIVRMIFWVIGLLLWFLGGFASYGHALV